MKPETRRKLGRVMLIIGFTSTLGGTLTAVSLLNDVRLAAGTLAIGFLSFLIGAELVIMSEDPKKDIGPSPT